MSHIPAEDYAARRARLIEEIGDDGVLILVAPPERQRSHDSHYIYRASSDILYLTGFREPGAVVVIAPGHADGSVFMFVRARDPEREQWDGRRAGVEGAQARFGADRAYTLDQLDVVLPSLLASRCTLYYTLGVDAQFDMRVVGYTRQLRHRRNAPPAAPGVIRDARDLLHRARLHKSAAELDVMRRAAQITADAHELAMRACKPGMAEYQLQAIVEYHFRRSGASYPAYTSIVGAGDNATILHYVENDALIQDGDIVLIDAGCELDYYAADITRSFPANGKFTGAQRELYQAVLEVEEAAIAACQVGLPYNELQQRTVRQLTEAMVHFKLLDGELDGLIETLAYKKYYPHGVGHWLGIDVHDVGPYFAEDGQWHTLQPGMVLTIEPGLYIPANDERAPQGLRGVGVRIEDDVLITAQGPDILTASCPKQVEAIEAIVGTGVQL